MKGYTSVQSVEKALGFELNPAQKESLTSLLPGLEAWIDLTLGHKYGMGTVTDEIHWHPCERLYVDHPPVSTITTVKARSGMGSAEITLVADQDYELALPEAGLIHLVGSSGYDRVRITYAQPTLVPDEVGFLATELGAIRARLIVEGVGIDVSSYTFGGEVQVAYFDQAMLPRHIRELIERLQFRSVG